MYPTIFGQCRTIEESVTLPLYFKRSQVNFVPYNSSIIICDENSSIVTPPPPFEMFKGGPRSQAYCVLNKKVVSSRNGTGTKKVQSDKDICFVLHISAVPLLLERLSLFYFV